MRDLFVSCTRDIQDAAAASMILKHGCVAIDRRKVPVEQGFARELFAHSYHKVVANVLNLQFKKRKPRAAKRMSSSHCPCDGSCSKP